MATSSGPVIAPCDHVWHLQWESANQNHHTGQRWILVTKRRWYCTNCRHIETTIDPQEGIVARD